MVRAKMEVVRNTRGYLEKMVTQINGCYEHQWYDASSVMIRKLAECLIFLVYDHKLDTLESGLTAGLLLSVEAARGLRLGWYLKGENV